jgi:adenosylhomocysteine nucleosidase
MECGSRRRQGRKKKAPGLKPGRYTVFIAKNYEMRFLITFAIDAEFNPWKARHPFVPYDYDTSGRKREFDMYRANIGAHEVTVLLTGMGPVSVARAMQIVPPETHDVWVSTGLAGALVEKLQLRTPVVARECMTPDLSLQVPCDTDFVNAALQCGATAVETFLTSQSIVATALEKESLASLAQVVEMESAHVLAAAQQRQIRAVAVRAISDVAEEDLPLDFAKIADERGHVKVGGLLKELALHPYRLPLLIRFGSHSRAAAVALADFLDRYIPALGQETRRTVLVNDWAVSAANAAGKKTGSLQ